MHFRDALLAIPEGDALPVHWAAARLTARWALLSHEDTPVTGPELLVVIEEQADDLLSQEGSCCSGHALDHAAATVWRSLREDRRREFANYLIYHICDISLEEND